MQKEKQNKKDGMKSRYAMKQNRKSSNQNSPFYGTGVKKRSVTVNGNTFNQNYISNAESENAIEPE